MGGLRHPYTNFKCDTCGAVIRAIVSYGVQALRMHTDRCGLATPDERETWRATRRWPRREGATAGTRTPSSAGESVK